MYTCIANADFSVPVSFGGQFFYYKFIPPKSGKYTVYSVGSADTVAALFDAAGNQIVRNDDGGDNLNFRLTRDLTGGTTYYYGIKFNSSSRTGTINVTLREVFIVSYNANGGLLAPAAQEKEFDKSLTLRSTTPAKSYIVNFNANASDAIVLPLLKTVDCTCSKWNTKADGTGASYNTGAVYTANAGTTLYAQWTNPTAGSLPTPARDGYVFVGWYTSPTGGTEVTSSTTITAGKTLYAHWERGNYTVHFDANGGSGAPADLTASKATS